jgi:hypothetical protein
VNDVVRTGKELFGMGFTKKQLNNIILHKNKVIADLEETAYDKPSKGGRIPSPPSRSSITDPSLLGSGVRKGRFAKGSAEAKAWGAKMKALRNK